MENEGYRTVSLTSMKKLFPDFVNTLIEDYENGKLKETCNYLNGLKHGKWIDYHEDGKINHWEIYYNDMHTFDWRYITILHVPKDFPQDKINMLCD